MLSLTGVLKMQVGNLTRQWATCIWSLVERSELDMDCGNEHR